MTAHAENCVPIVPDPCLYGVATEGHIHLDEAFGSLQIRHAIACQVVRSHTSDKYTTVIAITINKWGRGGVGAEIGMLGHIS